MCHLLYNVSYTQFLCSVVCYCLPPPLFVGGQEGCRTCDGAGGSQKRDPTSLSIQPVAPQTAPTGRSPTTGRPSGYILGMHFTCVIPCRLSSCTSIHSFSIGYNKFLLIFPFFRYWMCFLYLQEDLPYTEDLDGLGSLLGEDLPIDCATPSSSRLTHPPSSLLGSVFGHRSDVFCVSSPSISPSVTTQGPTVVTLDDSDDQTPPFDLSKHAPIHQRAGNKLQQLIAASPAAPLPLPVQKYDAHTPMTMYYGGHLVHYQMYDSLPHLLVYHLYKLVVYRSSASGSASADIRIRGYPHEF